MIVAVRTDAPGFITVNAGILPVPVAANPIAVLSFVHENIVPAVPVKFVATAIAPLQRI